jgi:hypothetical protein
VYAALRENAATNKDQTERPDSETGREAQKHFRIDLNRFWIPIVGER